jgi:hypothetical protein
MTTSSTSRSGASIDNENPPETLDSPCFARGPTIPTAPNSVLVAVNSEVVEGATLRVIQQSATARAPVEPENAATFLPIIKLSSLCKGTRIGSAFKFVETEVAR